MALAVRMILYYVFALISGLGWATFDSSAGTLTVSAEQLASLLVGGVGFSATFLWSRFAKARGGKT